ncbi:unnamed protein product [Ectocarpus sp. 4 AP-2014]|uniref:EsV-1-199 n=1 Tax=Ectocarpus siliculosus virus 1 (isolate New Zealand/Kaikoura/1988) TaxID=654926 RepID=Q8QN90_ESV1K|nr:EsV-1-199 [Ectocarpus siliculosus virus 1]AAK14613.1 EsV-1-199 [Ectocarpus siliculosus virus 1]
MDSPFVQHPRGPWTALHSAANHGSFEQVFGIVSSGSVQINQGSPEGWTPLMLAADGGYSRIVSFLLNKGAIARIMGDEGVTALHVSAKNGHVLVSIMLIRAGVDVGLSCSRSGGYTPLHLAAQHGRCAVMEVLMYAGADVDRCLEDGATSMYLAAERGQLRAVEILLANKADPMLATMEGYVPLDVATEKGHVDIVRELVERVGIEGCGGFDGGMVALRLAAQNGHLDILDILHKKGVVDSSGLALCAALMHGGEKTVKLLLQRSAEYSSPGGSSYANSALGAIGKPLLSCLVRDSLRGSSSRVMRRLIDAGATAAFTFTRLDYDGNFMHQTTALDMVTTLLREKRSGGTFFTQQQMYALRGMRQLLMQVDAVHAVSWGWTTRSAATASTPGALMVPIWRERAATKTRVCRKALFR